MSNHDINRGIQDEQLDLIRYQKARREWDDRYGSAQAQALNWRYLSFFLLGLLTVALVGMVYLGTLPKQSVHIVEIDKLGQAAYMGRSGLDSAHHRISEASRRYHLARFIEDVRSLPADTVVVKQQWEDAYTLLTPQAANVLSDHARRNPPTERMKQERVTVQGISLIPISEHSWSAEWEETLWNNQGSNHGTHKWKGIFNLVYQEPKTETQLKANPLGMYIDSFSWTAVE